MAQGRFDSATSTCLTPSEALLTMNDSQFISEVYAIARASNPDLNIHSSFQEVVKELADIKDKALRMDIIVSSFKSEPELPHIHRPTLRETQARRQGQL